MNKSTEQTYQEIYRSAFPKLVTYLQRRYPCNWQDAEDISAQALHILWQKWDTLESHTEAGMLRWLLLTTQNLMRDENKRKHRRPQLLSLEELTDNQHPLTMPELTLQQSEQEYTNYITEIMQRLSESDAALFHAKIIDHKPDEEIAARLGLTVNALRVRWFRIKRRILAMWDDLQQNT